MMNRTFRHRLTPAAIMMPVATALLALSFLWEKDMAGVLAGICLTALTVALIERLLHTEYVFSSGTLTVKRGRFTHKKEIRVGEITRASVVKRLLVTYILIEYGAGHSLSAQPDNADEFIKEIRKRQDAGNI